MPKGNDITDPTYQAGIIAAKLSADIELIEQTAILVDDVCSMNGTVYQLIIKHVTQDIPLSHLGFYGGKNQFTPIRRAFYYYLAKAKGMV